MGPSICPLKAIIGQGFHFTESSYSNAQLLPQVVAGTQTRTGFKHSTFRSEGEPKYPPDYTLTIC